MGCSKLPEHIRRIMPEQAFAFACHPGVTCFTECCRELELALTPYDVLRLRQATGLHSRELLDRYIIMEREEQEVFPRFYLSMVDDGMASCVFRTPSGCSVYRHRPGACRAYPVGRGTGLGRDTVNEFFVLLREPHCHGFAEPRQQTAPEYIDSQGLAAYNRFNDLVAVILQHPSIRQGRTLTAAERRAFVLALYDLDSFRTALGQGQCGDTRDIPETVQDDDDHLLEYGIRWLHRLLFDEPLSCRD